MPRLRASRGAIPGRAGPPHRSAGARRFFFSVERLCGLLQGGHDQTHLSSSSLDHYCPSRERHLVVPHRRRRWEHNDIISLREHDRALCDRTRPKRDRNETYRVCERKHGTCFSSVFVRRRPRFASRFDILYYSARFLGRFGFRDVICYFPRLLPLSFVSKGQRKSKGKKDDTTRLSGGIKKKRESEKLSKKRSTFCKTLNIEERFFFVFFCVCCSFV